MCLANLITKISWICEQLFVIYSRLIKQHSCNCWCELFSICTKNYCVNVISYEIFSIFSLKAIKDWSVNLWELQQRLSLILIRLLVSKRLRYNSWSWRIGLRMRFCKLLLLLIYWSRLLILIVIVLLISILTSSSSAALIASTSSSSSIITSVVSWISLALVHFSCLKLLLLPLILLILNVLNWLWLHHWSGIIFSVLKPKILWILL